MNFRNLFKSDVVRNVTTLMTGTTISQAIPLAVTPILTRIYTPEDFGVFALFLSITSIAGIIATARYELAILLPKNEEEALNIVYLSAFFSIIFSALLFIIIVLFDEQIVEYLGEPRIGNWLCFVPVSVLLIGFYNALNYYNIRHKNYAKVSQSLVSKSIGMSATQVGLGYSFIGATGLIIGQVVSYFFGNFILLKKLTARFSIAKTYNSALMKKMAKKYRKFPKLTLPGNMMNSISLNAITFFISNLFSTFILGHFSLASRVLGIPSRAIGGSISQVYYQKIAETRAQKIPIQAIFKGTFLRLVLISFPIFLVLFFIAEPLFAFVFGEAWRVAGTYAMVLIPLMAVRFVSSALSPVLHVFERQEITFFIQLFQMLTLFVLFGYVYFSQIDFYNTLKLYSLVYSLEYAIFIVIYFKIAKTNNV